MNTQHQDFNFTHDGIKYCACDSGYTNKTLGFRYEPLECELDTAVRCPMGEWKTEEGVCEKCAAGKYQPETGKVGEDNCINCQVRRASRERRGRDTRSERHQERTA